MKAVRYHSYGDSDVLVYEDAEPHGARFQLVLPVKSSGNSDPAKAEIDTPPEVEAHGRRLIGRWR